MQKKSTCPKRVPLRLVLSPAAPARSACHDSARARLTAYCMSRALHAGRFCLTSTRPAEFVTITSAGRRHVASPGAPDFMLEHEEALPAQSQLAAPSPDSEAEAIQSRLLSLARRADVRPSQASILLSAHEFGVGSTINGASTERPACPDHCTALRPLASAVVSAMVMVVLDALGRGHTLFLPKLRLWSQRDVCDRADMSCFFDSLPSLRSLHSQLELTHGVVATRRNDHNKQWATILRALEDDCAGKRCPDRVQRTYNACRTAQIPCPRLLKRTAALKLDETSILRRLPHQWVRRGRFWLVSQVLAFLTQPNAELRLLLENARSALHFQEHQPILALHVRKGDACTARGECRGLKHFMPQVWRMASAYGFRSVFLSTPSPEVQAETARYPRFRWLFLNSTRTSEAMSARSIVRIEDGLRKHTFDPVLEWQRYMLDLYLVADAQALVGSFSSNAARLAYSLMAQPDCIKPFYSGDNNWCWAFGRSGGEVVRRGSGPAERKTRVEICGLR